MEAINTRFEGWEMQAEVDVCLAANDVTRDQMIRWRRIGLLPDVEQDPHAYHGSTIYYPRGTCAQITAVVRLFKEKNRAEYVG